MTRIRIVTINTAKGDFDYSARIAWLASELAVLKPDIVLVQESLATVDDAEPLLDTAQMAAAALGIDHVVFAPARRKIRPIDEGERESYSGLAILSRYPILESTIVPLPATPEDGERITLLAEIGVGAARLLVGNLHLTYIHGPGMHEMRRAEVDATLQHPWFQRPHTATIIGGDFNTHLSHLPDLITDHPGLDVEDIWTIGGGSGPRATIPVHRSPMHERAKCIDYLVSVTDAGTLHPQFMETGVVLATASAEGRYPSDHRGIITTLVFDDSTQESITT